MKSYFFSLIVTIILLYISCQKNQKSVLPNKFNEIQEESENYPNLREWLNQLVIELPNALIENVTQGLVEDLTIYGINLDEIITTNPEKIDNRIGINISIANAGININGLFTLFSMDKPFTARISRLNILLPLYLIRDPETGLVTEVDTNGLDLDFENMEIELDLEIGDLLRNIVMAVLREVLLALKPEIIEPTLIDLMNNKIGGLFQEVNDIIINGTEPQKINITINEKEISDLRTSSLTSAVYYLINKLIGIDGPLNINSLINIITYDTGIIHLHEYYNQSINFEFNFNDQNNNSFGNFNVGLEDLNISGLNTWQKFTVLEPYDKTKLYSHTNLQDLTINASLSIKIQFDNSSILSANNTILYEKIILRTNIVNNTLKALIQLPINGEKAKGYTDKECLNLDCVLDLADDNGTGITFLSVNETFNYINLKISQESGLEDNLNEAIDKLIDLFISSFENKFNCFINAMLNKTLIDLVNSQINNYLYTNYCPGIKNPDDNEINKLYTSCAFSASFFVFLVLIFCPYILGRACKKNNPRNNIQNTEDITRVSELKNEKNREIHPTYCFQGISIQWIKEFGRTDPAGSSLFLNPNIPIFWRIFIPLGIISTIALFISSNSSTGASVFVVFKVGRRIQIPSLFDFGLINSVRDMWKAGVYPLSIIVALFSGIWPYAKLALMLISFCLPASLFSKRQRGKILRILDATGKWSILDSYVMTLMLVAFHFHIKFPIVEPSQATENSIIDVFVYAAYGFFTLILGTIISLFLSHIITHLHRGLDEHPDQNKGEKAESYKALISFAENKYLGKIPFRIIITFLLFITLGLVIIGSNTTTFSFYFHGLAGYALDLFDISDHRDYSVIDLGFNVPKSYENPKDGVIIFTQVIYFLTVFAMPVAMLINVIFLWLVPLPRKAQKFFYAIAEILNAWSCLDVFVLAIIAAIVEIGQFTEFIVGDKCDSIDPFIAKYFYKILDGHNTCFEVRAYLKSGCWILFVAAIIFFISSNIVMKVCRNSLDERLPDNVKEYLKNKDNEERINSISNFNTSIDNNRETLLRLSNDERISNINTTRNSNNTTNNF